MINLYTCIASFWLENQTYPNQNSLSPHKKHNLSELSKQDNITLGSQAQVVVAL